MAFDISKPIKVCNPHANVDSFYGTYKTKEEACASVPKEIRERGFTVGIDVSGTIVEHWWTDGIEDNQLVPKGGGIKTDSTLKGNGTDGNLLSINEEWLNSQDKYFINSQEKENISIKHLIISSNYGTVDVGKFSYPKKITIQGVQCLSNCSAVSFRYGGQVYDSDTLVGQTIPTDTEVEIFDITPLAGSEVANIRITFKEL